MLDKTQRICQMQGRFAKKSLYTPGPKIATTILGVTKAVSM